jgi:hypothetical protein
VPVPAGAAATSGTLDHNSAAATVGVCVRHCTTPASAASSAACTPTENAKPAFAPPGSLGSNDGGVEVLAFMPASDRRSCTSFSSMRCCRMQREPRPAHRSEPAAACFTDSDALDAGALQRVHHLDDRLVLDVAMAAAWRSCRRWAGRPRRW